MIGTKPFIERLTGGRTAPIFGSVIDPFVSLPPAPAPAPFQFQPSPIDVAAQGPREEPTTMESIATITAALSSSLTNEDSQGRTLLVQWMEFAEQLKGFFASSMDEHRKRIETEIAELTAKGRTILGELSSLANEYAQANMEWNTAEAKASELRAGLNAVINGRPDWENDFITEEEVQGWQARRDAAQRAVDEQRAAAEPLRSRITHLSMQIETKNRELATIRQTRKFRRAELSDGVHRDITSGLQGMPGKAGVVF